MHTVYMHPYITVPNITTRMYRLYGAPTYMNQNNGTLTYTNQHDGTKTYMNQDYVTPTHINQQNRTPTYMNQHQMQGINIPSKPLVNHHFRQGKRHHSMPNAILMIIYISTELTKNVY